MQKAQIREAGNVGMITDVEDIDLPPNAWTDLHNVRVINRAIKNGNGWQRAKTVENVDIQSTPWFDFVYCFVQADLTQWILAGIGSIFSFDGNALTDISDSDILGSGSLTQWNGGNLNDVLILTNGVDEPFQYSGSGTIATLSNWTAGATCRLIVPFKNHLVAADITDTTSYPHMVWWSHPADPGAVPISWDYTDPAVDAGRQTIGDSGGRITALYPLRDSLIIHKEDSVWEMRYVGGQSIFAFRRLLSESGAIGPYAVRNILGNQVYVTDDDIVAFDGQSTRSIVHNRVRDQIFDSMVPALAQKTYLMADADNKEMWVCVPTEDNISPNLAWIWSFRNDTWSRRDMPNARHGSEGWYLEMIQGGTDQWDTEAVYEWDSGPDNQWGGVVNDWLADGILVATDSKYLEWMGVGNIGAGGTAVVSTLERTGIQLGDEETVNRLLEIYPKIKSADDVLIQVGAYMDYNDTPSYVLGSSTESQDYSAAVGYYRPTADQKLNVSATGRLHAVKITFTQATDNDFSLTGYDLNYQPVGRR